MSPECTRLNNQRKLSSENGSGDALKTNKVGIKAMADKKDGERVVA